MKSIIYTSHIADDIQSESSLLHEIISHSQTANPAIGVTGAMIMSDRQFLQVIEGEEQAVLQLFTKISADKRHSQVDVLYHESISSRSFEQWSMQGFEVSPGATFDVETIAAVRQLFDQSFTYRADVFMKILGSVFAQSELIRQLRKAA